MERRTTPSAPNKAEMFATSVTKAVLDAMRAARSSCSSACFSFSEVSQPLYHDAHALWKHCKTYGKRTTVHA
eukprot:8231955-Alexandrium_andersonii.AAC.1